MSKSMKEIVEYFRELYRSREIFVLFEDTKEMTNCAKEMVDLADNEVNIWTWESEREVSKEEAKEYISKFNEKDGTPRGIQFSDNRVRWMLRIERYSLIDKDDTIDVMSLS